MTYCIGMLLDRGMVFMSDTRTNAGVDNISVFKKMHTWSVPGERVITILAAGNLASSQMVFSLLDERSKAPSERNQTLLAAPSMFQVAKIVGETLREVIRTNLQTGMEAETRFDATLLVGGQIKGGEQRLFMVYPEGNFIEAGPDTPFFQMGETKYGRPILVRAYDPALSFSDALKLLLVSFDSTIKANLSVGPPLDFQVYPKDSLTIGHERRIEADDPYFLSISNGWGDALKAAFASLPNTPVDC